MGYIGNRPADSYTSFAVQHFTTSATTTYTLDNPVANENEIALFINNVRQEPGSSYAYTASGTTLTLSAATSASDTMYCVFIGKAVQTVTPANNSVTNDMISYPLTESGATVSTFNRTTSDGNIIDIQKDGSTVGSIATTNSTLVIGSGDTGILFSGASDVIIPRNSSTASRDNAIGLGDSGNRFKDLYLGGNIYLGGTGSANALDDYETGTWTPRILFGGSDTGTTYGAQDGTYVKVGNLITAGFFLNVSSKGSATGTASLTGMPFNAGGSGDRWGGTISYYAGLSSVSGSPNLLIEPNSNNGALRKDGSTDLNNGNFNSGFSIYGVYIYTDQ